MGGGGREVGVDGVGTEGLDVDVRVAAEKFSGLFLIEKK